MTKPITVLFLDDDPARVPLFSERYQLNGSKFVFARTPKEFVDYLQTHSLPDVISFDHDLSEEHYSGYYRSQAETGLDCARWAIDNNYKPQLVLVHSFNPVGAANIVAAWQDANVLVKRRIFRSNVAHI